MNPFRKSPKPLQANERLAGTLTAADIGKLVTIKSDDEMVTLPLDRISHSVSMKTGRTYVGLRADGGSSWYTFIKSTDVIVVHEPADR